MANSIVYRGALVLLLVTACGGDKKRTEKGLCKDHVPGAEFPHDGTCSWGAKLVVEDRVAVCRCPEPSKETMREAVP